jgi:hypothetical protein
VLLNAVLTQPAIESTARNADYFGGLDSVPVAGLQRLDNSVALGDSMF